MKKLVVFIVAMSLSLSSLVATGDALYSLSVSGTEEGMKIILNLDQMIADQVDCKIIDAQGTTIHAEKIKTMDHKSRKYDISRLPEGEYTFVITDLMKIEKISFAVGKDKITFDDQLSEIVYKPTVWVNSDKTVDLNYLALGHDASVKITKDGEVVHKATFSDQMTIGQRFNLQDLDEGRYTLIVSSQGEEFRTLVVL